MTEKILTKQELEIILKALTLMKSAEIDFRKSLSTVEADMSAKYIELVKEELMREIAK